MKAIKDLDMLKGNSDGAVTILGSTCREHQKKKKTSALEECEET